MLSLNLRLSHTTMYTILIIPTITLAKDPLMPSLNHGMDIEDMVDTGAANVAPLMLSHGDMEDMDTVDTGDKIKVEDQGGEYHSPGVQQLGSCCSGQRCSPQSWWCLQTHKASQSQEYDQTAGGS